MASTDLLFDQAPNPTGGPVEIVFGDDGGGGTPDVVELHAAGTITGLRGRIGVRVAARLRAAGSITGLRGRIRVVFDVNVERPLAATTVNGWQDAAPVRASTQVRYEQAQPVHAGVQAVWQDARTVGTPHQARWQQARPLAATVRQVMQQALRLGSAPALQRFEDAERLRSIALQAMQQAQQLAAPPVLQRFEDATRLRHLVQSRFEEAEHRQASVRDVFGRAVPLSRVVAVRYEEARKLPPGVSAPVQPPIETPCYVPVLPAHLVFEDLADSSLPAGLVFVCDGHGPGPQPGETIVVPVRRTYIVINNITLHRVDTGAELNAHSFSMSLDHQSWTWSWTASLHNDAANHLGRDSAGDPAELAVLVNGVEFRLRLEGKSRDRRFSPTRWAVSGKGKASVLGSADAPKQSFRNLVDRTAQQLMADVLTVNGVPMGWTVDWGLEDWHVPAGAWAMQGNYIDAINDIAGAAGGYVQPHNTAATLRVLPRYPLAPWHWGSVTPDFEIPAHAAEVEGTEFIDKPAYNRVFLGGIGAGVFGPFTRAGTPGNVIAPQVNHALITHPDAHRQRGIAELSDTGKQERITLNMQVLPETGVIVPGKFIRYLGDTPVMGIVRSTSIEWSRPRLRQTLEIETHA